MLEESRPKERVQSKIQATPSHEKKTEKRKNWEMPKKSEVNNTPPGHKDFNKHSSLEMRGFCGVQTDRNKKNLYDFLGFFRIF
jgi:hypothetical protein